MNRVTTLDPSQGVFHEQEAPTYGAIMPGLRAPTGKEKNNVIDVADICFLSFIYLVEMHVFLLHADVSTPALCTGSHRR